MSQAGLNLHRGSEEPAQPSKPVVIYPQRAGSGPRPPQAPVSAGLTPATAPRARVSIDRVTALLIMTDAVALVLAQLLAGTPSAVAIVMWLVLLVTFQTASLYDTRLTLSIVDDVGRLGMGVLTTTSVVAIVAAFTMPEGTPTVLFMGMIALVVIVTARAAAYGFVRLARRRGWVGHRTLIIGTGDTAARVGRALGEHPEHGLRVVGYLGPRRDVAPELRPQVLAEDCRDLSSVSAKTQANVVVTTLSGVDDGEVLEALRTRDSSRPWTLFLVPQLHEFLHVREAERVRDVALIRLRRSILDAAPWRIKRAFDAAFAGVSLMLLSPLLLFVASMVYFEIRGDVLFRQTRIGRNGIPFTLYKFCSLRPDSAQESQELWSVSHDHRLGPVGRFIRRFSLDELPQLYNVLRGDMSLVGPRPERPFFVNRFSRQIPGYDMRHRVRPGLTGWAAVHGLRGDTSVEERTQFDNAYIDNWSLSLDLKVVAHTVGAVLRGHGA